MARKRKASRPLEPTSPREVDPAGARIHVASYQDVADSEDEYFINRDKILLEDEPRTKRTKGEKDDEMFELSDEEVLDWGDRDGADDSDMENEAGDPAGSRRDGSETDDDRGYWGSSKTEYYEADVPETDADALAEEVEAKRLQQKKLSRMSAADFVFDAAEWVVASEDSSGGNETITEILKAADVAPDAAPEEVGRILQVAYPEFDFLADELQQLQPRLDAFRKDADGMAAGSLQVVRFRTLASYVAALASYFAILTSPARDGPGQSRALDPALLRDHEVMDVLVTCRAAWLKVDAMKSNGEKEVGNGKDPATRLAMFETVQCAITAPEAEQHTDEHTAVPTPTAGNGIHAEKPNKDRRPAKTRKLDSYLESVSGLRVAVKHESDGTKKRKHKTTASRDDDSDFGDEATLDSVTAEDKSARRKSLRFYASQIVQKAGRRAGAGREVGGDMDIPYRERLRDRQSRLNAEAERRGRETHGRGDSLGGESDEGDAAVASAVREEEDEYYDAVAHATRQKRTEKAAKNEALMSAGRLDREVGVEQVGEDGKRQVNYAILKNKGLAPKRKKEVRNPRVRKRKRYEERQKRLKSVRAVYGGGEGRGGYQGELSGIKTGLIKSVKLS